MIHIMSSRYQSCIFKMLLNKISFVLKISIVSRCYSITKMLFKMPLNIRFPLSSRYQSCILSFTVLFFFNKKGCTIYFYIQFNQITDYIYHWDTVSLMQRSTFQKNLLSRCASKECIEDFFTFYKGVVLLLQNNQLLELMIWS